MGLGSPLGVAYRAGGRPARTTAARLAAHMCNLSKKDAQHEYNFNKTQKTSPDSYKNLSCREQQKELRYGESNPGLHGPSSWDKN